MMPRSPLKSSLTWPFLPQASQTGNDWDTNDWDTTEYNGLHAQPRPIKSIYRLI